MIQGKKLTLKKSQSVALPLASADEDTPMKGANEEAEAKEALPNQIDLNVTVNEIDEPPRGCATPGDFGRNGKKTQRKVAVQQKSQSHAKD
jgi:hypothetical protein